MTMLLNMLAGAAALAVVQLAALVWRNALRDRRTLPASPGVDLGATADLAAIRGRARAAQNANGGPRWGRSGGEIEAALVTMLAAAPQLLARMPRDVAVHFLCKYLAVWTAAGGDPNDWGWESSDSSAGDNNAVAEPDGATGQGDES